MATLQLKPSLTIPCSCLFIPTSLILTGLRFLTRRKQKAKLGVDDWLTIPACVLVLGMQINMIVAISKKELGYHDPHFVRGKTDAAANMPFYPFILQQTLALSLIKLSVIFFYRRIFNTKPAHVVNWATITMITIICAWAISFFFSFLFMCDTKPDDYWLSAQKEQKYCVKTQKLHLSAAVSDTILDIAVLVMPLPMIWRLNMSLSRKFAVTAVFSLGLITVAASLTRMVIFIQATRLRYDPDLDFEYLITASVYWSMIEVGLGFIATNLIVCYRVVAHGSILSALRSLRSLMSIPRFSRISSQGNESNTRLAQARTWPGEHTRKARPSGDEIGLDADDVSLARRGIYRLQKIEDRSREAQEYA